MCEIDVLVVVCVWVVVDICVGVLEEVGDLLQVIVEGVIGCEVIFIELCDLLSGVGWCGDFGEIILFKLVGYVLEDLVVVCWVVDNVV